MLFYFSGARAADLLECVNTEDGPCFNIFHKPCVTSPAKYGTGKSPVGLLLRDDRMAMDALSLRSVHVIDELTKTPLASDSGQLIDIENM